MSSSLGKWAALVFTLALFILAAQLAHQYKDILLSLELATGTQGMVLYVVVVIVSIVVAPLSSFPLLPVAVVLWGAMLAALLSIAAWTIGGVIAYVLARRIGRPIVKKFVSLEKADEIAQIATGKNPFWTVFLLRMIIPVDVLSYALGLLVPMKLSTYTFVTLVGVAPFAFIFSYATDYSLTTQIIVVVATILFIYLTYKRLAKKYRAR